MHEEPIFSTALIRESITHRAFRAELPNGKPIVAHLPKRHAALADSIRPGTRVRVALTPFNFDKARIEGARMTEKRLETTGK
jgi:translation initiation factor IF-1